MLQTWSFVGGLGRFESFKALRGRPYNVMLPDATDRLFSNQIVMSFYAISLWMLIALSVVLTIVMVRRQNVIVRRVGSRLYEQLSYLFMAAIGMWMGIVLGVKKTEAFSAVVQNWSMHVTLLIIARLPVRFR
jgi:hypothetical protein